MSLPAAARHRWGLDDGGEVGYIDLGDTVLLVPDGIREHRAALLGCLSESDWHEVRSGFGDDDLATE